jgi:sulfite exporter TauE/SafE
MHIFEPFLLGLATGPLCFGYCAPMLIPFLVSEQQRFTRTIHLMALFLLGRLTGYLVIGMFSGMIGSTVTERHLQDFASIANIGMGLLLLMFGIVKNFPKLEICKILQFEKSSLFSILVLGLLTGVNLCPPFIAAITGAVGTGTILNAIGYFLFFFLGTSLVLLPICAVGIFSCFQEMRDVARICVLLSGIWLIVKGIM